MKMYICIIILLFGITSCRISYPDESDIAKVEIKIPEYWTNAVQDSLFSNIDFLPLETTPECLISHIVNFSFQDSLLLINENRKRLLVFNDKGKFQYQLGSRGAGPGEYLEVRDFFINDKNQVEILDYNKIELYSLDGKYLSTKNYNFMGKDNYCNPKNFISSPLGGYFLWGHNDGNFSIEQKKKNPFMLHIDKEMKLIETFFTLGHGDGGCPLRFSIHDDRVIISPVFANYNVYQIDQEGKMSVRYRYNFGSNMLPYPFELNENDREKITVQIESLSKNYVLDLLVFQETDDWVYQNFIFKNVDYNLFYSKRTKDVYILTSYKAETNLDEIRFWRVRQKRGNQLVKDVEASWFRMELDRVSPETYKKYNLDRFKSLKEDDNPVLFIYTLR